MNAELTKDERIEKEARKIKTDALMERSNKKNASFQDGLNTWLFLRLAAIEIRLNEIVKAEGVRK